MKLGGTSAQIDANDAIDTTWGKKAYTSMEGASPSDYCIEVKMKMQAVQDNS